MNARVLLLVGLAVTFVSSSHAQAVGSCVTGTAQRFIENSQLRAAVFNTGSLFFGGSTTSADGYLIPKGQTVETQFGERPLSPIFAAGLWLGGAVDGEMRTAAARYGVWDFWPGPLDAAARPPTDCSAYDRIYVVTRDDIARYLSTGDLTDDLRDWPHQLGAPVLDGDGMEGNYDLRAGDQPNLIGDRAAWWVMNDAGNDHNPGLPLGVEVRAQAFVFGRESVAQSPVLTNTMFIRYEVINRRDRSIEDMYAAMWADPDLGDAGDDYVGSDTLSHMVYVYNATNEDARYGTAPPAQGIQVLQGPVVGDDTLRATSASTFLNCGGAESCTDPGVPEEYYFYMQGLWGNGTPYYELNNGFQQSGSGAPTTRFLFAGDPVTESFYSEMNVDGNGTNSPIGDRRMVISSGPFRLEPSASTTLLYALPYARGTSHLDSVAKLRGVAAALQIARANGAFERSTETLPGEFNGEFHSGPPLRLSQVRPNPLSGASRVRLTLPQEARVRATVIDALGRQLEVIVDGELPAGDTELAIPDGLAPGTYLLRVRVEPGGEETLTFTVAR